MRTMKISRGPEGLGYGAHVGVTAVLVLGFEKRCPLLLKQSFPEYESQSELPAAAGALSAGERSRVSSEGLCPTG